ncbi:hypothetical protein KSF73_00995 [Burkholderiaceae bacterium DAT-1]|nr:hypothetical protein [Burkholderiaceae bacterium DAT-1]
MTHLLGRILISLFACGINLSVGAVSAWQPFEWVSARLFGQTEPHAAILLRIPYQGKTCLVQLDTGFHGITSGSSPAHLREAVDQWFDGAETGPIGEHMRCGSLGAGYFAGSTLAIDFKAQRLRRIGQTSAISSPAGEPLKLITVPDWDGFFPVVEVEFPPLGRIPVMIDTGAAAFGVALFEESDWQVITAQTSIATDTAARGQTRAQCQSTVESQPVSIGTQLSRELHLSHCIAADFKPPAGVRGVLGMKAFESDVLYLDFVKGQWHVSASDQSAPVL